MKLAEIAALAEGLSPVIRDLMAAAMKPLNERIDELERLALARDDGELVRSLVTEAVAALPPTAPGKDGPPGRDGIDGRDGMPGERGVDGADGKNGIDGAPGRDGADGRPGRDGMDGKDGTDGATGERGADGAAGRDGRDGLDGAPGRDGTDGIDGKDGLDGADGAHGERGADGAAGRDGIDGKAGSDGAAGRDGKDGERGPEGAPGKLPAVRAWAAGVHYEGDVVTRAGATYQALKDTAAEPPHDDWVCIAAAGSDGADGRSFQIRGTYMEGALYEALDVVALNGGAFVARTSVPGPCPGPGWQLMASQGKQGKPGERGAPGRGDRGEPGLPVVAAHFDDNGLLTLVNGDGSTVGVDLYPLLSKIGG